MLSNLMPPEKQEHYKQQAKARLANAEKLFTDHPHQTGETYLQHLWFTVCMTTRIILTGLALIIHGVFPFLLTRTTSTQMAKIYKILDERKKKGWDMMDPGI